MIAPWWWLALVPIGTMLVVLAATSLPARLATGSPPPPPCDTNEDEPRRRGNLQAAEARDHGASS